MEARNNCTVEKYIIQSKDESKYIEILKQLVQEKGVEWIFTKLNSLTKSFITIDKDNVWKQYFINGKLMKKYGKILEHETIVKIELSSDRTNIFVLSKFIHTPKSHAKIKLRQMRILNLEVIQEWHKIVAKDIITFSLCPFGKYVYTAHKSGFVGRRSLTDKNLSNGKILSDQACK